MCMCIDADSPGMAEIISRADDVLEGRLYFTKIWDMERCETPYKVDFSKCTLEEWEVVRRPRVVLHAQSHGLP